MNPRLHSKVTSRYQALTPNKTQPRNSWGHKWYLWVKITIWKNRKFTMEISTISQNEDLLEYKIVHLFPSSRSFYMQCMCMLIEWMLTIDRFVFLIRSTQLMVSKKLPIIVKVNMMIKESASNGGNLRVFPFKRTFWYLTSVWRTKWVLGLHHN